MREGLAFVIACSLGAGAAAPACSPSPATAPIRPVPATTVRDFYPLAPGAVWSYRVRVPGDDGGVFTTTRVEAVSGALVDLASEGRRFRYRVEDRAILKTEAGYPLLQAPLVRDASWPIPGAGSVTVADVGRVVETAAGRFADCIVVREEVQDLGIRLETTYAPGVGPVLIEVWMSGVPAKRAELQSYTFPGGA